MNFLRSRVTWAGLALIAGANAAILASVALERGAPPESTLVLSRRELAPLGHGGMATESHALAFRLSYRTSAPLGKGWAWIDESWLPALGVDVARLKAPGEYGAFPASREVLLVLELDGPAYAASREAARRRASEDRTAADVNPGSDTLAKRAVASARSLVSEESEASRLFVVDAGLDQAALRARHPDTARKAIVRGIIRPSRDPKGRAGAWIVALSVPQITVPKELRESLGPDVARALARKPGEPAPNYEVTVAWGQHLTPRVLSARAGVP